MRASVWVTLSDAVARAAVAPAVFVDLFCAAWPLEDQTVILQRVPVSLRRFVTQFVGEQERTAMRDRIAASATEALAAAVPGSQRSVAIARVVASWSGDRQLLTQWAEGRGLPVGLHGDSDFRWLAVANLSAVGAFDLAALDEAAAQDETLQGRLNALRCRASMPDPEAKAWAWDQLTRREAGRSNYELNVLADGFWTVEEPAVVAPYVERYFADIPPLRDWVGEDALNRVALLAFPRVSDDRTEALSRSALRRDDLSPAVRRAMVDGDWQLREALASRRRFG